MSLPTTSTIRQIVELKKENERLQETINYLKMENFEYSVKCNRIENILSNIKAITRNNADQLVQASQNVCGVLEACGAMQAEPIQTTMMTPEILQSSKQSNKKSPDEGSLRYSNKAHVVKPHMSSAENSGRENKRNSPESTSDDTVSNGANDQNTTVAEDFSADNQLSSLDDVSQASASQSPVHSTVLSGNFHEVKIFLNPISQDVLNRESLKVRNSQRRSESSESPRNKYRSTEICDYVTRSRRVN